MSKQGKLVRQDGSGIWLAASLAAQKTGLTKPEFIRRADAGQLAFQVDRNGNPAWFSEPEITALSRERRAAELANPKPPARKLTDKQLEAKATREWKVQAKIVRYGGGGAVTAHLERAMLREIAQNDAKRKEGQPDD